MQDSQPQQDVVSQETPQPQSIPQVPSSNKKPLIIIGFIVILILIVVLSTFLVFVFRKKTKILVTPTQTPSYTSVSPIPTTPQNTISPSFLEKVILPKNKKTPVPHSDIFLTYTGSINPGKNCADCIASTSIDITQSNQTKNLGYSCGGIAGQCINSIEYFGYKITLERHIDSETIEVSVTK